MPLADTLKRGEDGRVGITLERAPGVLAAGASSVCVISDLLKGDPAQRARAFLAALGPQGAST